MASSSKYFRKRYKCPLPPIHIKIQQPQIFQSTSWTTCTLGMQRCRRKVHRNVRQYESRNGTCYWKYGIKRNQLAYGTFFNGSQLKSEVSLKWTNFKLPNLTFRTAAQQLTVRLLSAAGEIYLLMMATPSKHQLYRNETVFSVSLFNRKRAIQLKRDEFSSNKVSFDAIQEGRNAVNICRQREFIADGTRPRSMLWSRWGKWPNFLHTERH
jgi:hypothetical protein